MKQVFVSTSVYALAHDLGMQEAIDEFRRQLDYPDENALPVVRTIARLRQLVPEGVQLHVDGGATYIGMARSRAFHEAFKTGLSWLTLDDDIEVTTQTAGALLEVLEDVVPRIVFVPYLMRDASALTCTLPSVRVERDWKGAKLVAMPKGHGGGFGCVGMNRRAMELVVEAAPPELKWYDNGEPKLALFYERLEDGLWYGEDTSFFRFRVPESVTVEALLCGYVKHAGVPLKLDTL